MREAIRDYLEHLAALGRTPATREAYAFRLERFAKFAAKRGVKRLRDVSVELTRAYQASMARGGLTGRSRRSLIMTLRVFLAWAHERRLILSPLAHRIELPGRGRRLPPKPLSPSEVAEFLEVPGSDSLYDRRSRAMLEMLYG